MKSRFNTYLKSIASSLLGLSLLALFLLSNNLQAQVRATIDSTQIHIGEEIKYSILVQADTTALVQLPEGQTFLPLEVIESYPIDTSYAEQKMTLLKIYGLTQFDSGAYTIPQQRVIIGDKAFLTDSLRVEVANVAVDTTIQPMYNIRPPLEVGAKPTNWTWLIILFALAFIGAIVWFFRKRKALLEEAEAELPPYEQAMEALKNLDQSPIANQGGNKDYYSALTEIVKRYLDREVDQAALESTSDELIARLRMHKDAGHLDFNLETLNKLDAVLKRADLVKFAKLELTSEQATADRGDVELVINQTKEIIPEPTEEELQEDLDYQLAQLQKRKRKRIGLAGIVLLAAVLLTGVIYGSINGFDELSDKVFGNKTRDLAEGFWVRSEYGSPSVVIETPDVLVRVPTESADSLGFARKNMSTFVFGNNKDPLQILVSTYTLTDASKFNLDSGLDAALVTMEQNGAKNLIVKRDDFKTEKGVQGVKAYGEFNEQINDSKVSSEKSYYELILFTHEKGVQQVLVVYKDDGRFAEDIKDRIINSIELEIAKS